MSKKLLKFKTEENYILTKKSVSKPNVVYVEDIDTVHYLNLNANGHAYVDLGLPSGTLWATMNIGASNETERGLFFQYASIIGEDDCNNKYPCPYSSNGTKFTKYNIEETYGPIDNKVTLDSEDDAAHVVWGGDWKIPTSSQFNELLTNTTRSVVEIDGKFHLKLASNSKSDSFIILPLTGSGMDDTHNLEGYYSTSSLIDFLPPGYGLNVVKYNAITFGLTEDNELKNNSISTFLCDRKFGTVIRPVIQ